MQGHNVYPGHPDAYAHFSQFGDVFKTESDRGLAVLSMCVIEELLQRRIKYIVGTHFPDMVKVLAPPGRWSVLADAATMLGLLSPAERKDLNQLILIRNRFAHAAMESLAFDHHDVIHQLSHLKIHERFQIDAPFPTSPRERFINAVAGIYLIICMRDEIPILQPQDDLHMSTA